MLQFHQFFKEGIAGQKIIGAIGQGIFDDFVFVFYQIVFPIDTGPHLPAFIAMTAKEADMSFFRFTECLQDFGQVADAVDFVRDFLALR